LLDNARMENKTERRELRHKV